MAAQDGALRTEAQKGTGDASDGAMRTEAEKDGGAPALELVPRPNVVNIGSMI